MQIVRLLVTRTILLGLAIPFFSGCGTTTHLQPHSRLWQDAFADYVERAPIVVVAFAGPLDILGNLRSNKDPVLIRQRIDVEFVIRGDVPAGRSDFYYFSRPLVGAHGPPVAIVEGSRYVLFLMRDGRTLRSISDFRSPAFEVHSGKRGWLEDPRGSSVSEAVASILLTPGNGLVADEFAESISGSVGSLWPHVKASVLVRLLKRLAESDSLVVASQACRALSSYFEGQDACLDKFTKMDLPISKALTNLDEKRGERAERLGRLLSEQPALLFTDRSKQPTIEDLRDGLQLLTAHREPTIRALACIQFRRLFGANAEGCKSNAPDNR